ncbi:hypothetical protein PK35_09825 [Tamlana nanhaiensis]|uniref:Sugar-binding protein n=1 Tax=Neotamlana nanhaiensis TaxID=1382798 RepID=A0A0D7W1C1_9FLAO|nr:hypothetical protein [Tamlana nanhaiensis]KJD32498.1 hypothetical protein PK35_09825 [Tamlana nanhaiensis]
MKKISAFLISLLCLTSFGQQDETNKNFKKVTETETYSTLYSDGKRRISTSEINEYYYNKQGKITQNIRKTFYKNEPYAATRTTYFYNDKNKIDFTETTLLKDSLKYRTIYTYLNGAIQKKSTTYTSNNNLTNYSESFYYNQQNELITCDFLYSVMDLYTENRSRNLKATYTYNKKGQIIESDWTKSDSTYKYNRIVHFRNRKGYRTKAKVFNKNNKHLKTVTFKYVFDDKNNWIIMKHYEKKQLTKAIYREIEYYE